ncbi:MAG: peptide-methionine (S)-S-oxide reductase [Candidatus Bathyarchaeota archaeon]
MNENKNSNDLEIATLGGGCFWCMEAVYNQLKGIRKIVSGYSGGSTTHDPTTLNRQGADEGTQYRSIIFYHNEEQKKIAEQVINELMSENYFYSPIVTKVEPFVAFYPAEEYHKNYFQRHPEQPYCRIVISPKIAKLRKKFRDKLKT